MMNLFRVTMLQCYTTLAVLGLCLSVVNCSPPEYSDDAKAMAVVGEDPADTFALSTDTPALPIVDTARLAVPRLSVPRLAVVRGRAELLLGKDSYLPADYVLVRLRSDRTVRQAWTSATGVFVFEGVPPGKYELEVFDAPKPDRVAFRKTVEVGLDRLLELPVVHIPIDSVSPTAR